MYGSDASSGRIAVFNMKDGSLFHEFSGEHVTKSPRGIGFDQNGNIHFGRYELSAVQVSTLSGITLHSYTLYLQPPSVMVSLSTRQVIGYVVDRGNPQR